MLLLLLYLIINDLYNHKYSYMNNKSKCKNYFIIHLIRKKSQNLSLIIEWYVRVFSDSRMIFITI